MLKPVTSKAEDTDPPRKKTCFIGMPISTPPHLRGVYGDNPDHFRKVLECLFIPAVEQADMIPIPPISRGSEVIHADIIDNLQSADLMLVDMSGLNANVFFEFGIRTSLNKPVCVVRDNQTPAIPFDIGLINAHTYDWRLDWLLKKELPQLVEHLKLSMDRSSGQNPLWRHFGFKTTAQPAAAPTTEQGKLDLILSNLSGISANIANIAVTHEPADAVLRQVVIQPTSYWQAKEGMFIVNSLKEAMGALRKSGYVISETGKSISLLAPAETSPARDAEAKDLIRKFAPNMNVDLI